MSSNVLEFPIHADASSRLGYKSGRSSERETPVARSIGRTNSAGTPLRDILSQYQTWPCVVPIARASSDCEPASRQARSSGARLDMAAVYKEIGSDQLKSLLGTDYLKLGRLIGMREIDPIAFGTRVKRRREELGLSQPQLGKLVGMSQQGILSIEKGKSKRPRNMHELVEALVTTRDWLCWEEGERVALPNNPQELVRKRLEDLTDEQMAVVARFLKSLTDKNSEAA